MFGFLKAIFGGGVAEGYENINGATFKKILAENPKAIVIDVRTSGEFNGGHHTKAVNYDIMSGVFQKKLASLDKSKTYLLYCRSGNRSGQAARIMAQNGFTHIYNLVGGYGAL